MPIGNYTLLELSAAETRGRALQWDQTACVQFWASEAVIINLGLSDTVLCGAVDELC